MSAEYANSNIIFDEAAFSRQDEGSDEEFYSTDRMVAHLDSEALRVVTEIIGSVIVEESPAILDLMASWDSHLPENVSPRRVVGLGLNANELGANPVLDERVIHDLNSDPTLPFDDDSFDVVLNTVSVDYLTQPYQVFAEVARVLKPGGVFLVLYSNRFFPEKVVRVWQEANDGDRRMLVEDYFAASGAFDPVDSTSVRGLPRPADDRHAHSGLPSDPITAVWAEKSGGVAGRQQRRAPNLEPWFIRDPDALARRKAEVPETMACPYCEERLRKWAVPQTPFTEWDQEFLFVCFNDRCPFMLRGWQAMENQGNRGFTYRLMYNPGNQRCMSMPVPSLDAFKASIVDD